MSTYNSSSASGSRVRGSQEASTSHIARNHGNGRSNGHAEALDKDAPQLSSLTSNGHSLNGSHLRNGLTQVNGANGVDTISDSNYDSQNASTSFVPLYEGSPFDRREFVRLTLQSLRELGFESTAKSLEAESGITMEHPSIVAFRQAVLKGDWKNAERLLIDGLKYGASRMMSVSTSPSNSMDMDIVLRDPHRRNLDSIRFLIYQQRYLELIESRQTSKALSVLRDRLAPLNHGSDRLHHLSSLVICSTSDELKKRAQWLGSGPASRRKLLEDIESAVSPSVMIPSRRLPRLLEQAQMLQTSRDPFFSSAPDSRLSLYVDHRSDRSVFPTYPALTLSGHSDEVWHVTFSHVGDRLASVGKDKQAIEWSIGNTQDQCSILHRFGPLNGAICHVSWSPNDRNLLTTTDDGEVVIWDTESAARRSLKGHTYTVGSGCWLPDGHTVVTGGMDCRVIFWNLDKDESFTWDTSPFRVQALDVSPDGRFLVAVSHRASTSSNNRNAEQNITGGMEWNANLSSASRFEDDWRHSQTLYDSEIDDVVDLGGGSRTMTAERFQLHFYDIERKEETGSIFMFDEMTSVKFSNDSRSFLVTQRPNETHLWDFQRQSRLLRYTGHRVHSFVIYSCFGGADEAFIVTGSEDGYVYIYQRKTGKLLERLRGHTGSANGVAWHPDLRGIFASCGDDSNIRIWHPPPPEEAGDAPQAAITARTAAQLATTRIANAAEVNIRHGNGMREYEGPSGGQTSLGPSPFPWATSPRMPQSPNSSTTRRNERDEEARPVTNISSSGRSAQNQEDDDENEEEEEDEEEDEEEERDEDEEDEDDEDVMEE